MSKITLKEIIEYQKGAVFKSQDYQKQGVGIVRVSDFEGDSISLDNIYYISNEIADKNKKVRLKPYDVVITTVGATAGNFIRVPVEADGYLLNQNTVRLRTKENNKWDQIYLFYALKYKNFQEFLLLGAQGSAQPSIVLDQILDAEIAYPDNRREIAKKLFSMDQKIHLNTQINQTLEQIAQALFKSWFVDFDPVRAKVQALSDGMSLEQAELAAMQAINGKTPEELTALSQTQPDHYAELAETAKAFPCDMVEVDGIEVPKGWEIKALDEVANYQNGLALQKFRPENNEPFLPVVKIAQLRQGYADGDEKAKANIKPECIINNGDVVFSWSGSLLVDIWCGGKAALNQHLFKVSSKEYPKWFYYFYTKHHLTEFQRIAYDKAVTMGHIKREHLSAAKCIVPNDELLANKTLENILEKIIFNRLENFNLQDTRDLLLPRLLSGEI
ncbi:restriction endonuclease subunit S [Haemophilus sp. CCUG 66565]|uniref:restriction endonuclease subunit S n=1 Tax=Haemophilus TaxID=724 RepID=UPI000802E671|nr:MULTISPECIES: restriction endonuclease subunit S [Haemophilus]OBX89571.1 restriction endonuclease subunit S [Haemophilus sp. CCUG 66565]TPG91820.1 restriction endonuclease subunit S [Haemophilus haemolyticus]